MKKIVMIVGTPNAVRSHVACVHVPAHGGLAASRNVVRRREVKLQLVIDGLIIHDLPGGRV